MIDIINSVIESVGSALGTFIRLLSLSPFRIVKGLLSSDMAAYSEFIVLLNWVIPIAEMVVVLETWGLAVAVWYGLSVLLRWLKAVE